CLTVSLTAIATPEIYTLSLHDALPICLQLNIDGHDMFSRLVGEFNASNILAVYSSAVLLGFQALDVLTALSDLEPPPGRFQVIRDRKSTRLNSSHVKISYAVFCLKKKK